MHTKKLIVRATNVVKRHAKIITPRVKLPSPLTPSVGGGVSIVLGQPQSGRMRSLIKGRCAKTRLQSMSPQLKRAVFVMSRQFIKSVHLINLCTACRSKGVESKLLLLEKLVKPLYID